MSGPMRLVPWITIVAAVVVVISPLGQDVYKSSFVSSEGISNSIGQFLLAVIISALAGCALIEFGVRCWFRRRRVQGP